MYGELKQKKMNSAAKITGIYVVMGAFFIMFFANMTDIASPDRNIFIHNMFFLAYFRLAVTAAILYFLIRHDVKMIEESGKKVLETEKRYNIIFNVSSVVKLLINYKSDKIIDANKAALSFFEIEKNKLEEINFKDLFSDQSDYERIKEYIDSHPAKGSQVFKQQVPNKEIRYLEIFLDYLNEDENNLVYLTVYDITEKFFLEKQNREYSKNLEKLVKERTADLLHTNMLLETENKRILIAEQRIENQLRFFKTIMETIPIPLFIKGRDGRYIDCNKEFAIYFDMPKEEIIGKTVYSIVPDEAAKISADFDEEIYLLRKEKRIEISFTDKKNMEHYIQYTKTPLLNSEGVVEGIIGIINDITEYKKLQLDIKKALEKEQEISSLKSRFISMASHEFRTPLTTILASTDLLEMFGRKWSEEKYNEHTAKIRRTVKNMVDLLDDVLTISRAETGKLNFNPANINLFNFCCEVVDNMRNNKSEKHTINFEYLDDRKIVSADSKLLGYMLNNLISNAIKYSPDGGEITFRVSFDEKKDTLNFLIKDKGIGISSEYKNTLFEPFLRGENIGRIPGTGLGLSIVKRAVDLHRGAINFESELGKGTSVSIEIPLR